MYILRQRRIIATERADIVVLADRAGRYTGKPRPALVIQANAFAGTDSLLVCLITSTERDAPLLRVALPASEQTPASVGGTFGAVAR